MKYIRTKYGIGVFRNAGDGNDSNYDYVAFNKYARPYNDLDIIKQADTIEELCDEFVAYDNGGINKEEIVKEKLAMSLLKQGGRWTIYGAIWTDKGLIYVAKLNDKCKLELI